MNPHSRHIAAAVKRIVWQRDAGRCAFKGHLGRCTETGFLEYHHVVPFADGGESSAENLELRCRRHNAYEAEQWSGSVEVPLLRESRAYYGTSRQLVPERGREKELALR
jgi:5-methylcytosine-specific restriction endonuclease McrA